MYEQDENLTKIFNNVLNDFRKQITKQIQSEVKSHSQNLISENPMVKYQVLQLKKLNISNESNHKDLEQYGRHLCLRIDGVPTKSHKSSDDVLGSTKT